MREYLLDLGKLHKILGTVLVAPEGLNGALYGKSSSLTGFHSDLQKKNKQDISPFITPLKNSSLVPFSKFKVKIKKELVKLGMPALNPALASCQVGEYLNPHEWNKVIQNPNTITVDTRNDYEYFMGHFRNAVNPNTKFFTDFPKFVKEYFGSHNKKDINKLNIAMYCTGGIRCEKATAYMIKHNFKNVYHLQHGILEYLKVMPKNQSLWEGVCYVFDDRVVIDESMHSVKLSSKDLDERIHSLKNASRHERHTYSKIMRCVV